MIKELTYREVHKVRNVPVEDVIEYLKTLPAGDILESHIRVSELTGRGLIKFIEYPETWPDKDF